jgi:hypothetical protein
MDGTKVMKFTMERYSWWVISTDSDERDSNSISPISDLKTATFPKKSEIRFNSLQRLVTFV